jgi:hypothetical protein
MTAHGGTSPSVSVSRVWAAGAAVSTLLVLALALQSAVPPFATEMYTTD